MMHTYRQPDVTACLRDRKVLFIGDSTIRQIFWAFADKLNAQATREQEAVADKHSNLEYSQGAVSLKFIWDPFLNKTQSHAALSQQKKRMSGSSRSNGNSQAPDLLAVGGGLWFAKHLTYENATREFGQAVQRLLTDLDLKQVARKGPVIVPPMQDLVAIAPVQEVDYSNPRLDKRLTPAKINHMNELLHKATYNTVAPVIWSLKEVARADATGYAEDGVHKVKEIVERQADILLNLRCNSILMRDQPYPRNKTCCVAYPEPNWVQTILLKVGLLGLPIIFWATSMGKFPEARTDSLLTESPRFSPASLAAIEEDATGLRHTRRCNMLMLLCRPDPRL